ncbi:MAG TPA: methyltransferase domain-containing protein [Terriglobales bacterium]
MSQAVNLYDGAYENYESETYREIRTETYGEDYGQTSWVTTDESEEIPQLLALKADSSVLEIGCGSGGYALHLAEKIGCRILGLDVNVPGIRNANRLAAVKNLVSRARFEDQDVSRTLPLNDGSFDAVFSNDVLCHLPDRADILREMFRVTRPGGRMLFSDALIIGGTVSYQELTIRSSIGFYMYSPPGENERLIEEAGFRLVRVSDTTQDAASIAKRWHDAREKRKARLIAIENEPTFEGLQRFLASVFKLCSERRLLRYCYVTDKAAS